MRWRTKYHDGYVRGDVVSYTKFAWWPTRIDDHWYWLETLVYTWECVTFIVGAEHPAKLFRSVPRDIEWTLKKIETAK